MGIDLDAFVLGPFISLLGSSYAIGI
ncbi:hypothetical protein RSC2_03820 [Bacillus paralicheniformis]|nr:hypothetical protein RSC1_01960 [Bacillus paralicheniformis]BCE12024.1 hypothetical protein RSC2_03820 [Bacillus paralicheniformis]BCE13642.1 hypothetical protein RSC3_00998 [Bacillus paralicheniformis]